MTTAPARPHRLAPGDAIGIVAPASPFDRELFQSGVAVLASMGFQTVIPDELFKKEGYLAGGDGHRAALVNRFFSDPAIRAIVCARGGYGALRMLPLLDIQLIRSRPKIFIGFSDISAILAMIPEKCGFVAFHGPMVTTLPGAPEETKEAFYTAVTSDAPLSLSGPQGVTVAPGKAIGPVAGGNLTTLCHLVGTPFMPDLNGHILLLEDRGEAGYRIDRMLSHMKLAGCFNGLAGLILGAFDGCGPQDEIIRIFRDIFREQEIPILAGFPVGHGPVNLTVPLGLEATLDADGHRLVFQEPATEKD